MSQPAPAGGGFLTTTDVRAALRSLTAIERVLCTRLIVRQLTNSARIQRVVDEWGAEGAVRLCSSRALFFYLLPIGVIAVLFAVAGVGVVAVTAYVFLVFLLAGGIGRAASAASSGRRWRDREGNGTGKA